MHREHDRACDQRKQPSQKDARDARACKRSPKPVVVQRSALRFMMP
jgi:hypothetical protein